MSQLQEMTKQIVDVFQKYDAQGTKTWDYTIAVHDLQYQIGNLTKCILQINGYRYKENLDLAHIKTKAADELSDILAEVLFIAHELNIDIEQAWQDMLHSDETKILERSK